MTAYRDARDAVVAVWAANWPAPVGVPVFWHANGNDQVPDPDTTPHYLHLSVEFAEEAIRAFGGDRFANDRVLGGSVVIRLLAARGQGEDTGLDLLSSAMTTFRSRREGNLSFVGDAYIPEPGASEDGNWHLRSAIAVFEYRFQG